MKILITIQDISLFGGAERVVVNLANAFAKRNHEVILRSYFRAKQDLPFSLQPNVKLEFMSEISKAEYFISKDKNIFTRFYYKNIWQPLLAWKEKRHYKDINIMIANSVYFPFFKNKRTQYIKIEHLCFERYFTRNNLFDILVVLAHKELDIWQRYHKNVLVIPNFLPAISKKNTDSAQKVVLSVGRMDRGDQKGFLRLLDIWALLKNTKDFQKEFQGWKLCIVGDGAMKNEIESKISYLGLQESVILKPFTKTIEKEYLSASIYVMASHFEGFPMVLLESCSYGLPPVAFDIKTGPSDIIADSESGFLVQDGDLQGFANALQNLINNESLRQKMGQNAKERMKKYFSEEAVMEQWLAICQSKK